MYDFFFLDIFFFLASDFSPAITRIQVELADSQAAVTRTQREVDQLAISLRTIQDDLAHEKNAHDASTKERDVLRATLVCVY
jgi:hypothetical protein